MPHDLTVIATDLQELGVRRRQFIKARIRVLNAAGALVRRALGWRGDLDEAASAKISKQAAAIMAADDPAELAPGLASIAQALAAEIATAKLMAEPGEKHQHTIELAMRRLARQLPVWPWAQAVHVFSDLGLAIVVAEAGPLERYANKGKLWKRFGLAPFTKDGETKALSSWRGGLNAEEWTEAAYKPSRRAAIFAQVGGPLIGAMGKGYRPPVDEDIEQNNNLSHYGKMFVRRLRYEAARDPEMRRPDTKEGKESYSKFCAFRAQRYTEKIFIRDLWIAWRRATIALPDGAASGVPSAEMPANGLLPRGQGSCAGISNSVAPSGAASAILHMPQGQRLVADATSSPARKRKASASPDVPQGQNGTADATHSHAPHGAKRAKAFVPQKAGKSMPASNSDAPQGAASAVNIVPQGHW